MAEAEAEATTEPHSSKSLTFNSFAQHTCRLLNKHNMGIQCHVTCVNQVSSHFEAFTSLACSNLYSSLGSSRDIDMQ